LAGCGQRDAVEDSTTTRVSALTQRLAPVADTFINSVDPDNNNGASLSFFTGQNGQSGVMRALLAFELPAGLQGRVTVDAVTLTVTTEGLGTGTTPQTPATESLRVVEVAWTEGSGAGNTMGTYTVGQPCGSTGATWNNPDCTGGTPWTGGDVATTVSGTGSVPASIETTVTWDSAAGNADLIADVQSWFDDPTTNHGWQISSSTEAANAQAQRFYSREVAGKAPSLSVTLACKPDFADAGPACGADLPADAGGADAAGDADAAGGAGGAGDGGAGGRAGGGGAGLGGGTGAAGSGEPSAGGGGCSCSTPEGDARPGALLLFGVALLVGRTRRRARRPSLTRQEGVAVRQR